MTQVKRGDCFYKVFELGRDDVVQSISKGIVLRQEQGRFDVVIRGGLFVMVKLLVDCSWWWEVEGVFVGLFLFYS